jgi:hypothetical protein
MTITQIDLASEFPELQELLSEDFTYSNGRRFGHLESYYSKKELTIRLAALVDGRINIELMKAAFTALAAGNPVLRSTVRQDDEGYFLQTSDSDIPPTFVGCGDPLSFVNELSAPIDQTTHLAELAIVQGKDETGVALTICHNIADMTALGAYFRELWENYTKLVAYGVIVDHQIRAIPNGPEHWLDPNDAPVMPPPLEGEFVEPVSIVSGAMSVRDRIQLEFSEATTSALRQLTKQQGTTVHAAVTGAVLTAERSLIAQEGPVPMALRSSVDLRRRLKNPVQPLEATALLGQVMTQLLVDRDELPLAVGSRVVEDIRSHIDDGTAIYSSVQPTDAYRPPISYAVNGGAIPEIPTPDHTEIKKIVFGNSKHIEYRALTYASWTYAGRLIIDIGVPHKAMSQASRTELANKIQEGIESIAKGQA